VGLFVLAVVFGVATTVWRVATAQRLAKRSGMDPGLATQMTLLSDDGLDATYLAANLRGHVQPESQTAVEPQPTAPTTAARLEELSSLLDRGLITQQEHDERRKAIIDSV
jgi:Short C-terminal domain